MTTSKVKIGKPLTSLPDGDGRGRKTPHWDAVADACAKSPGKWLPVTVTGKDATFHLQAVSRISHSELVSFRGVQHEAVMRGGQLYVRLAPALASVAPIKRGKRVAS